MATDPESSGAADVTILRIADPDTAAEFAGMTYPAYRSVLTQDVPALRIGAKRGDEVVGLALAVPRDPPSAEVLSVYVDPDYRSQGIGTRLMQTLEEGLRQFGAARCSFVYPSGKPITPAVERLLEKAGWPKAEPRMLLFTVEVNPEAIEKLKRAPWYTKTTPPGGSSVFPWGELSAEEAATMQAEQAAAEWYPEMLSPFADPDNVDPRASLGIRYQGRVVGWFICHRISDHALRYTALYVRPDVAVNGMGFFLLIEAIRRFVQNPEGDTLATFGILAQNPVAGFVQRRVLPFLCLASLTTTQVSEKVFVS